MNNLGICPKMGFTGHTHKSVFVVDINVCRIYAYKLLSNVHVWVLKVP